MKPRSKASASRLGVGVECAIDDRTLMLRIIDRDRLAFETLYKRYYRRLFRFILRTIGHIELVEEVINDVMFVVWNKADCFNEKSKPSTWIIGIAYYKSLKALQRVSALSNHISADEIDLVSPVNREGTLNRKELQDWIALGLQQLSPEQRAVVELAYFSGYRYAEIAEIVDCPENTVKTRMFHARKRLKKILPELNSYVTKTENENGS